jgi:hypothetical protein
VVFLCGPQSRYVTGTTLMLDGGARTCAERHVREPVHVAHVHALHVGLVDLVLREAGRELLERDPALEPRQ